VGLFIQILGERLLQSTGRTVHSMIGQSAGAITNIVLDPVFIFGVPALGIPAMGIAGAAIATVIGQFVGASIVWFFNFTQNPDVQLRLKYLLPRKDVLAGILTVGVPAIVMNSIGSVMNFGMNQILQGFQETATGVFGIYFKLQSFFFMPLFGLNGATISIVAFNYGAQKPERIVKTLKIATGVALSFMLLGLLVFQAVPQLLLGMFNPSDEFLRIGCVALRTISWCFPVAAVCIVLGACFQALGNGIYSTIVSLCRQMIVLLPVAYLLSLTGEVNNVWIAFPVADAVSMVTTLILFRKIFREKIKPMF
jgi:putative MATE family efflux protein